MATKTGDPTPTKPTGEISITRVTATNEGQVAELISSNLPTNKEALEQTFATLFVDAYNAGNLQRGTVSPGSSITIVSQNDTTDLDFSIQSDLGDYLELAEVAPLSESFGRAALRTGKFHVLEMARWIYRSLIQRKFIKYGDELAGRTLLLLYITNWQFLISDRTIECIASLCRTNGCKFAGVYIYQGSAGHLNLVSKVFPWDEGALPSPKAFRDFKLANGRPGQSSLSGDFADLGPQPD